MTTDMGNSGTAQQSDSITSQIKPNSLKDYGYGIVIGAAIGDSLGSFLEFSYVVPQGRLEQAMKMFGGGTWGTRVRAGQVTDDTEMAISLARGLCYMIKDNIHNSSTKDDINTNINTTDDSKIETIHGHHKYDSKYIGDQYYHWYKSDPFDMGMCTSSTCSYAYDISEMKATAFRYNKRCTRANKITSGNLANGSLMRCTPLILYGHKLNQNDLHSLMKEDSSLTHANDIIYYINTAYALACQYLMVHPLSNNNNNLRHRYAFECAEQWLNKQKQMTIIDSNVNNNDDGMYEYEYGETVQFMGNLCIISGINLAVQPPKVTVQMLNDETGQPIITQFKCLSKVKPLLVEKEEMEKEPETKIELVLQWLEYCKGDDCKKLHRATDHLGFLKIAFQRSFWHLWKNSDFETAIKETVAEGGDTDTNACIVGGIMGALHGLSGIPKRFVDKIINCVPAEPKRDDQFQAKLYFNEGMVDVLLENAPIKISIKEYVDENDINCSDSDQEAPGIFQIL